MIALSIGWTPFHKVLRHLLLGGHALIPPSGCRRSDGVVRVIRRISFGDRYEACPEENCREKVAKTRLKQRDYFRLIPEGLQLIRLAKDVKQ